MLLWYEEGNTMDVLDIDVYQAVAPRVSQRDHGRTGPGHVPGDRRDLLRRLELRPPWRGQSAPQELLHLRLRPPTTGRRGPAQRRHSQASLGGDHRVPVARGSRDFFDYRVKQKIYATPWDGTVKVRANLNEDFQVTRNN